jgi:hypothetical protein
MKIWVFDFLARSAEQECMVLMVSIWHVWSARNSVRIGDPVRHPHTIVQHIKAFVELIKVHLFDPKPSIRRDSNSSRACWCPPPEGVC